MAPSLAPRRMNAAIAKVPAVIAVPTLVAGVSRSVVMPCIETVSALTANDAWIWVRTTTMSGSQEAVWAAVDAGAAGRVLDIPCSLVVFNRQDLPRDQLPWTGQNTGTNRIATAAYSAMTARPNFQ